jgi:hypothetical protein
VDGLKKTGVRIFFLAAISIGFFAASAYLSAGRGSESVNVRLCLVDAETGKDVAGIIRIFSVGQDSPLALPTRSACRPPRHLLPRTKNSLPSSRRTGGTISYTLSRTPGKTSLLEK